jgi:hypothetical protein
MSVKRLLVFLTIGVLFGYFLGFRLPEEKRNRALKLMREGLEMPFRLFVCGIPITSHPVKRYMGGREWQGKITTLWS